MRAENGLNGNKKDFNMKSFGKSTMVPRTGFEPVTLGLEVLCSIQLSYRGVSVIIPVICGIIDMK